MKTTTLCLVVTLALTVLILAILWQGPKKKPKEGFATNVKEVGIGVAIGIAIILVVFLGFFVYFYSFPKQPNVVIPRRSLYWNME